jgi:hypothetical protein
MAFIRKIRRDGKSYDVGAKNLQNDFTQTEAGVNALDAAAGKTLNDTLNSTVKRTHAITEIVSGADLNTYTTEGEYYIAINSTAENVSNVPTLLAGRLTVEYSLSPTDNYKLQTYITYHGEKYTRESSNNGASWSSWVRDITTAVDFVKILYVRATLPANQGNVLVGASVPSGYTFVGWVYAATYGWTGHIYPSSSLPQSQFYTSSPIATNDRQFDAFYLVRKSS